MSGLNPRHLPETTDDELIATYRRVTEKQWREMSAHELHLWQGEITSRGLATQLAEKLLLTTLPHERMLQRWALKSAAEESKEMDQNESPETGESKPSETSETGSSEPSTLTPEEARVQWEATKRQVQPLVDLARKVGLIPSEEDKDDRVFLTRLANDPRHPMTPEMVDMLMSMPHGRRVQVMNGLPLWKRLPTQDTSLPEASTEPGESSNAREIARAAGLVKEGGLPSSEASSGAPTAAASGFGIEAYARLPLSAKRDAFVHDGFLYVRRATFREWFDHLTAGKCCTAQRNGGSGHSVSCWIYLDGVR